MPRPNPAAVAQANAWYTPTGKFQAKLLTLYNAIDPLAPNIIHETRLQAAVARAGNGDRLVQRSVPAQRMLIPTTEAQGYVHCGFTPDQVDAAWNDLRAWVEQDKKPAP
jgi:hypothetical protein